MEEIKQLKTKEEAEDLVKRINQQLRKLQAGENKSQLATSQIAGLRTLRQRAYDKKKTLPQAITYTQENKREKTMEFASLLANHQTKPTNHHNEETHDSSTQLTSIKSQIKLQEVIIYSICTLASCTGIYLQSLQLYEATQLPNLQFCSLLTLLLVIGFPLIYSLKRAKFAFWMCVYVYVYEIILVIFGTITYDKAQAHVQVEQSEKIVYLKEKLERDKLSYQTARDSYDNPASNVYHNAWYKEKMLSPSLNNYEQTQQKLESTIKTEQTNSNNYVPILVLKILFRLALVALCMVSVHYLIENLILPKK